MKIDEADRLDHYVVETDTILNDPQLAGQGIILYGHCLKRDVPVVVKLSVIYDKSGRPAEHASCTFELGNGDVVKSRIVQPQDVEAAVLRRVTHRHTPFVVRVYDTMTVCFEAPVWTYMDMMSRHRGLDAAPKGSRPLGQVIRDASLLRVLFDVRGRARIRERNVAYMHSIRRLSDDYQRLVDVEKRLESARRSRVAQSYAEIPPLLEDIERRLQFLVNEDARRDKIVGVHVMVQERLDGTLEDLIANARRFNQRSSIIHALVAQQVLALAQIKSVLHVVHGDAHDRNWMFRRVHPESFVHCTVDGRRYAIPTHGALLKLIDFGQSAYVTSPTTRDIRITTSDIHADNPYVMRRQDDLLQVMAGVLDVRGGALEPIVAATMGTWVSTDPSLSDIVRRVTKIVARRDVEAYQRNVLGLRVTTPEQLRVYQSVVSTRVVAPHLNEMSLITPADLGGMGLLDAFLVPHFM
jgi:hypothetical protein